MKKKHKFRYTTRKVSCTGKRDGRGWKYSIWPFKSQVPVQPADTEIELAPYVREILRAADDDLTDFAVEWSDRDIKLKTEYCQKLVKLHHAARELKAEEKDFELAKREFDEAEDQFEAMKQPAFSKTAELAWILFLAFGEYFLNYLIFTTLGADDLDTHIIAGVISAAVPLSAMYFGFLLRKQNKDVFERFLAIVMAVAPLIVFAGISVIRASMFSVAWEDMESRPDISPYTMSIIFISLNVFIFLLGTVISYYSSHADPETYRTLKMRMMRARQRFQKEASDHEQSSVQYENARIDFEKIKHYRKETFDEIVARANDLIQIARLYVSIYQDSNIGERKSGTIPPCFRLPIPILQLPPALRPDALDWNCNPDEDSPLKAFSAN